MVPSSGKLLSAMATCELQRSPRADMIDLRFRGIEGRCWAQLGCLDLTNKSANVAQVFEKMESRAPDSWNQGVQADIYNHWEESKFTLTRASGLRAEETKFMVRDVDMCDD